jgi:succinate dehydrogenase / fumarate reductase cytochrome b subunit
MSNSTATRQRPLSPHLFIYKPIPTMVMSIVHRMTGAALYFGTLLVAWWLIAASISQEYFDLVSAVYGSWIGRLVLFCYTWALVHHMIGGIRHLVWDTGTGLEKETATKMAWVTVVASVVLTILIWIAGYMARGA